MATVLRTLVRVVLAAALLGALLIALFVGLDWALTPDDRPIAAENLYDPLTGLPEETETAEAAPAPPLPPPPTPGPPTPTGDPPEVLIAAAAAPGETSIQVLDAGGGPAATDRVVGALEQLGYEVAFVTSSRRDVAATTVWFVENREPEARALRARDPRFQEVGANEGLSADVDLHVFVGPNF